MLGSKQKPASGGRSAPGGLALATVTAVIKHLIENGLAQRNVTSQLGGELTVSALPPDRIPSGGDERAQLNIFLHRVTPHTTLRFGGAGGDSGRPAASTLTLELHYLITAYGAQDYQSEILLGHAIDVLRGASSLERDRLRQTVAALTTTADRRVVPPALAALAASDIADRVESLTVVPEFLDTEEISKLWSALQARFRPSLTYKVTAVPVSVDDDG